MTRVININRAPSTWETDSSFVYIGRGSLFGNPFVIGEHGDRREVLRRYRIYLDERLREQEFFDEFIRLRDKTLVCFCKPKACHGDILVGLLSRI